MDIGPFTNSPDYSLYIFLKNYSAEIISINFYQLLIKDQTFPLVMTLSILIIFSLNDVLIVLGEN